MIFRDYFLDYYFAVSELQLVIVTQLLIIIGMYGIFMKVGERSRIALLPFVHWIKLGDLLGHEKFGVITALTGIIMFAMIQMTNLPDWDDITISIMSRVSIIGFLFFGVLHIVFRMIMFYWLLYYSGRSKWWMLAFAFLPGCTMTFFGISRRIQVEL